MTGQPLMLRNVRAGAASVCDRLTGFPVADIRRDRQRFRFPGYGSTVATVWRVSVAGHELAVDRTRSGAVTAALPVLQRIRLLRNEKL